MKQLIEALELKREKLNDTWHNLEELAPESGEHWVTIRSAMFLVDVLILSLRNCTPENGQDLLLKAFGAPGDWGYGTPIGDGLLAVLKEAMPNPNRWINLRKFPDALPDQEVQVLGFDGERHLILYLNENDEWMEEDNDEPVESFKPIAWRHLDNLSV